MNDVVEPTPAVTGLDRFSAALGDELEAHARTLPARTRVTRARRRPRRVALAVATGAVVAAGALAVGLGADRAGSPAEASAASVMRAAAAALPSASRGPLPVGAYWHTVVDVTMRHGAARPDDRQHLTTERWETWQSRDGSGRERTTPDPGESPSDRRLPATDRPFAFGSDSLTYDQLERLPTNPSALERTLTGMVERQRGEIPASFDAGQARAYLLFTLIRDSFEAPTSPALRAALYKLTATAPGLELGGAVTDNAGRTGTAVTVVLGDARFVLIVDPHTGTLLETQRILLRAGHQFPGMAPGLISRATFLESDVTSSRRGDRATRRTG